MDRITSALTPEQIQLHREEMRRHFGAEGRKPEDIEQLIDEMFELAEIVILACESPNTKLAEGDTDLDVPLRDLK